MTSFRALKFEMEALGYEHIRSGPVWKFYLADDALPSRVPDPHKRSYMVATTARGRFVLAEIIAPDGSHVVTLHEDEIERLREDMVREASDGLAT